MQFTWSDYGDNKYFHIFDTDTQELTPVLNPLTLFEKAFYDDSKESFETIANADYSKYAGKFTKVIVINKDNPYWFDTFLDKIHKSFDFSDTEFCAFSGRCSSSLTKELPGKKSNEDGWDYTIEFAARCLASLLPLSRKKHKVQVLSCFLYV